MDPEVARLTGLSKATINRSYRDGSFPRPLRLGPQSIGWPRNETLEWLGSLPRAGAEGTLTRTSIGKGGDDRRSRHGGRSHTIRNEGKNVGCKLPKT